MKPPRFDYHDPETVEEAVALLAELRDSASVLAGGQSLIPLMNMRLATPEAIVDIRRVGLDSLDVTDTEVRVGAMVRASGMERDPRLAEGIPGLAMALHQVGHPQIRNRTTIGGNVAHADPSSELPAVLTALEGSVTLRSAARGERAVGADEFFVTVFTTAREPDELVTEVRFPIFPGPSAFLEVARRPGDFAIVGAFVAVRTVDGTVREARIALSGTGDRPVRAREAEAEVAGRRLSPSVIAEAARSASASLRPSHDIHGTSEYRRALAEVLVERGLQHVLEERRPS
jgi:carbon-monoxide dehydrogenase medium subunit